MTPANAILDASVFVRAGVQGSRAAQRWLNAIEDEEVAGHVPELLYAEVASGLLNYVRDGSISTTEASAALEIVGRFPVRAHPLGALVPSALALAVDTGLSAYDCCYAVLAESLDATLVTADRRLAAAVLGAELIG